VYLTIEANAGEIVVLTVDQQGGDDVR
jgi:hypothetical protein